MLNLNSKLSNFLIIAANSPRVKDLLPSMSDSSNTCATISAISKSDIVGPTMILTHLWTSNSPLIICIFCLISKKLKEKKCVIAYRFDHRCRNHTFEKPKNI